MVFRILAQHYRASHSHSIYLCTHYALLVKLLWGPLKKEKEQLTIAVLEAVAGVAHCTQDNRWVSTDRD